MQALLQEHSDLVRQVFQHTLSYKINSSKDIQFKKQPSHHGKCQKRFAFCFFLNWMSTEIPQASARASRFTPELSNVERFQLRRDAIERIRTHNQENGTNLRWRDIRDQLWLDPKS